MTAAQAPAAPAPAFLRGWGTVAVLVAAYALSRLRGLAVALYLLLGNLVGMSLGPLSVGVLLDQVLHDPKRVGWALAAVAAAVVGPSFLLLARARKRYAARAEAIAGEAV